MSANNRGKRWCDQHRLWEVAPRCVDCGKPAKLQRYVSLADAHRWWWPCGHAEANKSRPVVTA